MTLIRRLSLLAAATTLIQIGSGGLVRATGSGDGCPDWPRCFGRWVPPLEYHALIEYSHRFMASIAIILVLATGVVALVRHRREPRLVWPSAIAGFTIIGLAGIGAAVVNSGLNETFVTLHIAVAMALVGALVFVAVVARRTSAGGGPTADAVDRGTRRLAFAAAASTFGLILIGADVRGSGAGLVFTDWPLMNGQVLPDLGDGLALRHFLHRAAAGVVGVVVATFVIRAWRARERNRAVAGFAALAGGLFLAQALVGAAQVWTKLAAPPVALHVWFSALTWASLVAAVTSAVPARTSVRGATGAEDSAPAPAVPSAAQRLNAYLQLTKPRIITLLLITTVPTMIVAAGGIPNLWLVALTLVGGTLAAGSANTINCFLDRDIDSIMKRTRGRPLPAHRVEPARALAFGIALAVVSFVLMTSTINLLSASLAQAAILFYVFVYTLGLKRSTPQNIVIGGAAGAVPCLVGWAAVRGSLGWEPAVLFAIIFFWTPPHFWALAMRYAADYAAAGVPMMPVVAGARSTQRQIFAYTLVTVAVTLLLYPVARMGAVYLVAAVVLGAWFVRHAVVLWRTGTQQAAMGLFRASISYLALLFAAIGLDAAVRIGV